MKNFKTTVLAAKDTLLAKTGAGNDFLGWIDLPVNYDKEEFARIKEAAAKIQQDSDVLLVIGIGGSYLGARAAIEFLSHSFYNVLPKGVRKTPEIYFVGNSISSKYIHDLKQVLEGKDFSINIISKSGTTRSRRSLSGCSRRCSLKSMEERKQIRESTLPRIAQREP